MRVGIILSSNFINDDLRTEFGNIVPTELPLANKPLFYYQYKLLIEYCDKVIVTLPKGYKSSLIQSNILYYDSKLNLFSLIKKLSKDLNGCYEFVFYYGDTIINSEIISNTIYASTPPFKYSSWYYIDKSNIFCGCLVVEKNILDLALFESNNLTKLISNLIEKLKIKVIHDWLDFGNYSSFYNSRKKFFGNRSFNSINVNEDSILTKKSNDIAKIYYEWNWLNFFSNIIPSNCPTPKNFNIKKNNAQYSIEYFALPTLSDLFIYGKNDFSFWKEIILKSKQLITKIHNSLPKKPYELNFYSEKLNERIILLSEQDFDISNDSIKIQKTISNFLDQNEEYLVGSHGDFCFSNLMYDFRSGVIKVIDPRGYMDKKNGASFYMPQSYDFLKFAHSLIAGYDFVIALNKTNINHDNIEFFENIFKVDNKKLYAGLSHLFFTMLPLHFDNSNRQKHFLEISNHYSSLFLNS